MNKKLKGCIEMPLPLSPSLPELGILFMVIVSYIIPSEMGKTLSLTTYRSFHKKFRWAKLFYSDLGIFQTLKPKLI